MSEIKENMECFQASVISYAFYMQKCWNISICYVSYKSSIGQLLLLS